MKAPVRIQIVALAVLVGEATALSQLIAEPWGALLAGVAAALAIASVLLVGHR
jgi:hypothetical protein